MGMNRKRRKGGYSMKFQMKPEGGFVTELPYGTLHVSGDETQGFRPYQLMVSSLAVCSGGVLRKILEKMRFNITDITIEAEVKRNEEIANRIEHVHLHFTIEGTDLDERKIQKAMELTKKNCSMVQSVLGAIDVKETFEIKKHN
jgi:putative redox protein